MLFIACLQFSQAGKDSMSKVRVCENVQESNLRQLAAHVVTQALRELRGRDPLASVNAFLWLTGPDFAWWAEWAGMPLADPFRMLQTGAARKMEKRGKYGK